MERMVIPENSLFSPLIIELYNGLKLLCAFCTVILYHSVFHRKCRPQKGYTRACLKSNVCLEFVGEVCLSICQICKLKMIV